MSINVIDETTKSLPIYNITEFVKCIFGLDSLTNESKARTNVFDCWAMINLQHIDNNGWFMSAYVKEHNHKLSDLQMFTQNNGILIGGSMHMRANQLYEDNITLSKTHFI